MKGLAPLIGTARDIRINLTAQTESMTPPWLILNFAGIVLEATFYGKHRPTTAFDSDN